MASYSAEAADQVVRITLEGTETVVRLAGSGAREIATLIYAVLKDQKKTKGKTRLLNMLKSGKELRIFAVRDEDLSRFSSEARRYGILYTVLKDRSADDGITDVMVKREDAARVNRIFERFSLARVDIASVRAELEKEREEKDVPKKDPFLSSQEKTDEYIDEILDRDVARDPGKGTDIPSPRSVPSSAWRSATERDATERLFPERPSVRKQLEEIRKQLRNKGRSRERETVRKAVRNRQTGGRESI